MFLIFFITLSSGIDTFGLGLDFLEHNIKAATLAIATIGSTTIRAI